MVLKKSFRVFLLSLLVVMFSVCLAFAADATVSEDITFTWNGNKTTTDNQWAVASNWIASPDFASYDKAALQSSVTASEWYPGGVVFVSGHSKDIKVVISKDADIVLGQRLLGYVSLLSTDAKAEDVEINLGAYDLNGALSIDVASSTALTITGTSGLKVGGLEDGSGDVSQWKINGTFTLNAPVTLSTVKGLSIDVAANKTFTANGAFTGTSGKLQVVLGDSSTLKTDQASLFDGLTLSADAKSTLELNADISKTPTNFTLSTNSVINVASGKTVTFAPAVGKGIKADSFIKKGAGTLTFKGSTGTADTTYTNAYQKLNPAGAFAKLTKITVGEGTLSLLNAAETGDGVYVLSVDTAGKEKSKDFTPAIGSVDKVTLKVSPDATLNIGSYALRLKSADLEIASGGTVNIEEHGVFLDGYKGTTQLKSEDFAAGKVATGLSVDVDGTFNVNGDNAIVGLVSKGTAKKKATGKVNVASGKELILYAKTSDVTKNFHTFLGTITADNVGLMGGEFVYPFKLDGDAPATVSINTLKVYDTLMLDDTVDFADSENIYLRMKKSADVKSVTDFRSKVEVGNLTVTSGEVKIGGKLIIDGTGDGAKAAQIIFSGDNNKKQALTVGSLVLHNNVDEITTAYYQGAYGFLASGDGVLTLNSVTGGTEDTAHPSGAIGIQGGATLKIAGNIPAGNGVKIFEGSTLDVANGVHVQGNLDLGSGTVLKATLTDENATANGKYAIIVEQKLTIGDKTAAKISADIKLDDTTLGDIASTYGRQYKVIGVTNAANLNIANASFDVKVSGNNASLFKQVPNGDKSLFTDDKGVILTVDVEIQVASVDVSAVSYDKENFGGGKPFKVTVPYTYTSSYADNYKSYIIVSPDVKFSDSGVAGRTEIDPSKQIVTITGTANVTPVDVTLTLDWKKSNSEDLAASSTVASGIRNTTIETAWDDTNKQKLLTTNNLKEEYFIPVTVTFTLGEEQEDNTTEITEEVDLTLDKTTITSADEMIYITVEGLTKYVESSASMPKLVNDKYVWDDTDAGKATDRYVMKTASGDVVVTELSVVVESDTTGTKVIPASALNVSDDVTSTTIGVKVSDLGGTGDKASEIKTLTVQGTKTDGTGMLSSTPVTVTLLGTAASITELSPDVDSGYETVIVTDEAATYTGSVTLPDSVSGDVTWDKTSLPDWMDLVDTTGGAELSWKEGTAVTVLTSETYPVVLIGTDAANNVYRYTWTVTVNRSATVAPVITVRASSSVENGAEYTATFTTEADVSWDVDGDLPTWLTATTNEARRYVLSGTASETELPANYTFKVLATNANGTDSKDVTLAVVVPAVRVTGPRVITPVDETFYEGYNYVSVMEIENASGDVEWELNSPTATWLTGAKSGDKAFVLSGILPEFTGDSEADDYYFYISVKVNGEYVEGFGAYSEDEDENEAQEYDVMVEEDTTTAVTPSGDWIDATESVANIEEAGEDYKVVITVPFNSDGEPEYDGIDSEEYINLPDWLTYEVHRNADDYIDRVTITRKPGVEVPEGATAPVKIRLYDDEHTLSWNVTNTVAPTPITVTPETITVALGQTATAQASVEIVSSDTDWVTFSGVTITAAPTDPALVGEHTVTLTAANGRTVEVTVVVTDGSTGSFTISALDSTDVAIQLPGMGMVRLAVEGAESVSFDATVDPAEGLHVDFDYNENLVLLMPETAGTYVVTITATDANGNSAQSPVVLNVTVTEEEDTGNFTVEASKTDVPLTVGGSDTVTLTASETTGTVTWTVGTLPAGITVDPMTAEGETAEFTIAAAEGAQSGVVEITATDQSGTKTVRLNVTISSGESFELVVSNPITNDNIGNNVSTDVTATVTIPSDGWKVFVDGQEVNWVTIAATSSTTARVTIGTIPSTLAAGSHTITVQATSAEGTQTQLVGSFTITRGGGVGSSGGGCDAGFGALALAFAAPLFLRKRRS